MDLRFHGELWYWRGPAPFHFVTVAPEESDAIDEVARRVTYGWGMIPARVSIGSTEIRTSLWPKDGGYIVPVKKALRDAEGLELGDTVEVRLRLDV